MRQLFDEFTLRHLQGRIYHVEGIRKILYSEWSIQKSTLSDEGRMGDNGLVLTNP